ncbi:MAG: hypothetical protein J5769_00290, partial [Bacteroidales bacterium]|nr:hypothetical protein [Bacteroidales bacterium]
MKKKIIATIFICGSIVMFTSCRTDKTLPKCYDLIADEYKEILLDPNLEEKFASVVQDQGENFTIDSPTAGQKLKIYFYRPDSVGPEEK